MIKRKVMMKKKKKEKSKKERKKERNQTIRRCLQFIDHATGFRV